MLLQEILQKTLCQCKSVNPSFSLRALARRLELNPAELSLIMAGKRVPSEKKALGILGRLPLSPDEINRYKSLRTIGQCPKNELEIQVVDQRHFEFISEWEHFCILSMMEFPEFGEFDTIEHQSAWLINKASLSPQRLSLVLENLRHLGLVDSTGSKFKLAQQVAIKTKDDIALLAGRGRHHRNLIQAQESLHEIDLEWREFQAMTLRLSAQHMAKAKKLIRDFKEKFTSLMEETDADPTDVYEMGVYFYPHTNKKEKKEIKIFNTTHGV